MRNFIEDGKTIDYTVTGAAIKSGEVVVIGDRIGVAVTDGEIGETIALAVDGVYELPKGSGALAQGTKVYVNVTEGVKTVVGAASGNTFCGFVWAKAETAAQTVAVKIY